MSKQSEAVGNILILIFPDIQEEVGLENVTGIKLHKGIRVDFWVQSLSLVIEVHGKQHFSQQSFGRSSCETANTFNRQLNRDSKLVKICNDFNINYEQIDYTSKVDFFSMYNQFSKYLVTEDA